MTRRAFVAALITMILMTTPAHAMDLAVRASGGSTVRITINGGPKPDTARLLYVSAELVEVVLGGPESFYRASEIELFGADSPWQHVVTYTSLPPGHYEIRATIYDTAAKVIASAKTSFITAAR